MSLSSSRKPRASGVLLLTDCAKKCSRFHLLSDALVFFSCETATSSEQLEKQSRARKGHLGKRFERKARSGTLAVEVEIIAESERHLENLLQVRTPQTLFTNRRL